MDVKKDQKYWLDKAENFSIILYDKRKYQHIGRWTQITNRNGNGNWGWKIVPSEKVQEWLTDNLIGDYHFRSVRVDPSEVPNGEQELRRKQLYRPDNNYLNRIRIIFETDIDLIHFKMRWY
jgi:hypothetical protein